MASTNRVRTESEGTPAFPPTEVPVAGVSWQRNLAFISIGVFVGLLGANFVFPFIPFYLRELGVDSKSDRAFWTGVSGSVTGLSLTLTAPVWGSMADRFGRKSMFLRALIGAGILIGLMGVAQTLWHFVLLRFIMGAFAGTMGAAAALVAATTPRAKVGYALGMLQSAQFTANMLGPLVGGVVSASLGLRESFFFCAALYAAAVLLVWLFVNEGDGHPEPLPVPSKAAPSGGLIYNLRIVIAERQIVVMLIFLFLLWLGTTFVRPVMPISIDDFAESDEHVRFSIASRRIDMSEELATGLVFGIIGLTSTIAALSVGPVGERIGYRKSVVGAAGITGLLFVPVALAQNYVAFFVLMGATGLFQGAMVPGTNALIAAAVPEGKQGSAFGLAASAQSMALLLGPLAGG
ncbi:MAG: MFS transporter, partial [Hyphomicrobiales bacterium]